MTKDELLQKAALICVYVLVAEERPSPVKLPRYLGIEGGHVVHRRTLLVGMPDEEAFVQELDSVPDVHNMTIDDCLAQTGVCFMASVFNPIVINRPANLQTRDGLGARKQPDINVIAIFLVIGRLVGEIVKTRVAGSVFGNIIQSQSP